MSKVKVAVAGTVGKSVSIETGATVGATIGTDLRMPDGTLVTPVKLIAYLGLSDVASGGGTSAGSVRDHRLLRGLTLGDDHPQYVRKDTLTTRGDIYVRGATSVVRLPLGPVDQILRSNGTDADWYDADADPTAEVGLTPVVGTANTFMRSDGAPALDQSIAPTWTGQHEFSLTPTVGSVPVVLETRQVIAGEGLDGGGALSGDVTIELEAAIVSLLAAVEDATFLTEADETAVFANARRLVAGANITIDSTTPGQLVIASSGGGAGGVSTVSSGTGISVNNTDPANPIVNLSPASVASLALADSAVQPGDLAAVAFSGDYSDLIGAPSSIVATVSSGTGVTVDNTDPANPIVNLSSASIASLALADSAVQVEDLATVAFSGAYADLTGTPADLSALNFVTSTDETPSLPSSRRLVAGTNITLDTATPGQLIIASTGGGGGGSGANPTAAVGLTAVNGVATTFIRSDGAPALSQSIAPTWTGQHAWTQALRAPDGDASTPAYSFSLDTDTGIFRNGSNDIGFAAGGSTVMRILATDIVMLQPIASVDGTASKPAWNFDADADTGLFRVAADAIGFAAGGVRRLVLASTDASFEVPVFALAGAAATPSYTFDADRDTGIYRVGTNTIGLTAGGVLGLAVDASRRVYGTALHNNSSPPTGTTDQFIASGTYTPTVTAVSNVSSVSASGCQWMRVGNVVTVSGEVSGTPTAGNSTVVIGISLPIPSALISRSQCAGSAMPVQGDTLGNNPFSFVAGDTVNDRAQLSSVNASAGASVAYGFSFTYVVR